MKRDEIERHTRRYKISCALTKLAKQRDYWHIWDRDIKCIKCGIYRKEFHSYRKPAACQSLVLREIQ